MRPRGPPKQVLLNLLQKLHESKSIEAMAKAQSRNLQTLKSTESGNRKDPKRKEILGNAKVYLNLDIARIEFYSKRAISMVHTLEHGFGALHYQGSTRG
jgi:hypothetical protein